MTNERGRQLRRPFAPLQTCFTGVRDDDHGRGAIRNDDEDRDYDRQHLPE